MKEILEKVKKVISERTGLENKEIRMDSYFTDDLNINSLELTEIISELEEIYETDFDLVVDDVKTISELVHAISDAIE